MIVDFGCRSCGGISWEWSTEDHVCHTSSWALKYFGHLKYQTRWQDICKYFRSMTAGGKSIARFPVARYHKPSNPHKWHELMLHESRQLGIIAVRTARHLNFAIFGDSEPHVDCSGTKILNSRIVAMSQGPQKLLSKSSAHRFTSTDRTRMLNCKQDLQMVELEQVRLWNANKN